MEVSKNISSIKIRAGKNKTYYLDLKEIDSGKVCISITEARKLRNSFGDETAPLNQKSRVFIDMDDISRMLKGLESLYAEMKASMPDYDFEKFDRRDAEYKRMDDEQKKVSATNELQE